MTAQVRFVRSLFSLFCHQSKFSPRAIAASIWVVSTAFCLSAAAQTVQFSLKVKQEFAAKEKAKLAPKLTAKAVPPKARKAA